MSPTSHMLRKDTSGAIFSTRPLSVRASRVKRVHRVGPRVRGIKAHIRREQLSVRGPGEGVAMEARRKALALLLSFDLEVLASSPEK